MTARVVTVSRAERIPWTGRRSLPTLLRALFVTSRRLLGNLVRVARGGHDALAAEVAGERVAYPDAFRGQPVLVARGDGEPRCVACGLCAFACPTDCIEVTLAEHTHVGVPAEGGGGAQPGAEIRPRPERFDIDLARCMFCGLCEEACPEEAIVMSPVVARASLARADLVHRKQQLLVPESLLEPRLALLRAQRAAAAGGPR